MAGTYPPPALDLGTMDYLFRVFTPFEDTCSEVEREQRVSAVVARLGPSPGNDIFADTFTKAFAFSSMLAHGSPEQSFVPEWRSDYYAVAYRSRSWRNILVEGNQTLADFVDSQTFESPETLAAVLSAFERKAIELKFDEAGLALASRRLAATISISDVNLGNLTASDKEVFIFNTGRVNELREAIHERSSLMVREARFYPVEARFIFSLLTSRILGRSIDNLSTGHQ
jgi:hypothetical protein